MSSLFETGKHELYILGRQSALQDNELLRPERGLASLPPPLAIFHEADNTMLALCRYWTVSLIRACLNAWHLGTVGGWRTRVGWIRNPTRTSIPPVKSS
jgi:hypothetical protein